ncbi:MAG: alpha/beta hydrolase [Chloroflexi bacterium]|nr:alpha/beta hydrolase [Chloroflexota bacterium]
MILWQSGDIVVNGLTLHFTRTGGAKPPVVLAHGFSDDGLCWTPVAEALEADYDVVMVDARGHGRSAAPEQGYGSADHANDLASVIQELGLKMPAVLGHSMGAASTLVLAGTYPDLPRAILLEDPPTGWAPAAVQEAPARLSALRLGIIELKRKTREELIAHARSASPTWSEAELGPWADAKLRFSFNILVRREPETVDWPATVRRITCPALLLTADPALGALVTPESAAALQALTPQTRIAHIAGAGHSIRREQFARYMETVCDFLAETNV